ncbi:sulfatase [Rubritalea tangerina]|uniref:Sulfatase n=1 Tax=Rubritalea tangerina TaxID=430798 RepID=A0ABW4ZDX8_9BACT
MHFRSLLLSALLTTTLLAKPNVVFIAIDDMRPEIGCYGASHVKTPHMDALSKNAVTFHKAYCQQAICGPSRASLLTGMRPDSSKVHGNHSHYRDIHPNLKTLPELFKDHGYHTFAAGKINHGVFPKGMAPKWDCMGDPQSWSEPAFRPGPRYYYTEEGIKAAQSVFKKRFKNRPLSDWDKYLTFGPLTEAPDVSDDTLYDGQVAAKAVEKLKDFSQNPNQPFFLALGFIKPHTPYIAPKKYWDLYQRDAIPLAKNQNFPTGAPTWAGHASSELRRYTDQPKRGTFSEAQQRKTKHGYYACISYIDAQIGRVLQSLDQLNLRKNTIVILWSDHGYHLGEQNLWGKTTNYELDTRVVLICSAPNKPGNGQASHALVELVDIYPTLTDLANLPTPKSCEGKSFAPLLESPNKIWKPAAYSQFPRGKRKGYSLTDGKYRYIEWIENNAVIARELYNHQSDPYESTNIADKEPLEVKRLSKLLDRGQGWKLMNE